MKQLLIVLALFLILGCKDDVRINKLEAGYYRALLKVNDSLDLPFNFEVTSSNTLNIFNADEIISIADITYKNDSVRINMPTFEGYIIAKLSNNTNLKGFFINESLNRVVPFSTKGHLNTRFDVDSEIPKNEISGNWETVFSPESEADTYMAKGIFNQIGNKVTGTFRTTTGDYRYLEGVVDGNKLKLSTFDGAHAFLFTATVTDSTMVGQFYSGNHWQEPFVAKRNVTFELPNENELTFLKEGYSSVEFSFPDENGKIISLTDARFKDKVVLVQIMGTWCPNCLDESKFYSEFYKNNTDKDIEIVALAFEYAKTQEKAFYGIMRLKNKVGIEYPILLAQYGTTNKLSAQEKLPMLNHILSYPTTIFIDKMGVVRKIHTGFNGPATGTKYNEFKSEFEGFVGKLLKE
jgi:peroxiredoxin